MKFLLFFLYMPIFLSAQPDIKFDLAYSGYDRPVDIAAPDDATDRLFIVEQEGRIKVIENQTPLSANFLDITSSVRCCGERGLLGLVFHPNYSVNGYFFTNYVDNSNRTTISRWQVSTDDNIADPNSEKVLLRVQQPFSNHNAGDLNFSPIDGYLYIALGDGGAAGDPACYAQDSTSFLGKILRIDADVSSDTPPFYTIPASNPFLSSASTPDEIWALGLRNPWRVSFDRETGDYWLADVGQGQHEEVNFVQAGTPGGLNFGWKVMEGNSCYDGDPDCPDTETPPCFSGIYTDPIFQRNRTNANGARSITGGYVYRGCKYPAMKGLYICSDYVTDNSWFMNASGIATIFDGGVEGVTTYGEDTDGELYVATVPDQGTGNGFIYRVIDQDIENDLLLTTDDYPLTGSYRAIRKITIDDPLDQDLSGVKFITSELQLSNNVTIPESSNLVVTNDFCEGE